MAQVRHLSSADIYAEKYTCVSVSIPEAGCGDHTLRHNGIILRKAVIDRSPLLQSLLSTEGETCVPISSDHFNIWATYESARTVDTSALLPILEVCGTLCILFLTLDLLFVNPALRGCSLQQRIIRWPRSYPCNIPEYQMCHSHALIFVFVAPSISGAFEYRVARSLYAPKQ